MLLYYVCYYLSISLYIYRTVPTQVMCYHYHFQPHLISKNYEISMELNLQA